MKVIFNFFSILYLVFSSINSCLSITAEDIQLNLTKQSKDNILFFEVKLPDGWKNSKIPDIYINSIDNKVLTDWFYDNIKGLYILKCKIDSKKPTTINFRFFVCKNFCCILDKKFNFIPKNITNNKSIFIMVLFGFIGGCLLNVMPCVLPVILLKLRNIISRKVIIASIIGNYLTFGFFSIMLAIFKIFGKNIGWGIHFQNIYFLKILTIIFFTLILITFNKINIFWNTQINIKTNNLIFKNIISSIVTTLIAIPCTAPILGSAAAFAITQENFFHLFFIFFAISTGFSTPYFLALFLNISKFSILLKSHLFQKFVNIGIIGVFIWLIWQLFYRVDIEEFFIILICFIISYFLFIKNKKTIAIIILIILPFINLSSQKECNVFNFNRIQDLVDKNRIVIVNITADWCLSCKYNKLKFKDSEIKRKIQENNVELIEIDFTEYNDNVMQYIKHYSRIGIPFTIIYGPNKKQGLLLSELLSVNDLKQAIDMVK